MMKLVLKNFTLFKPLENKELLFSVESLSFQNGCINIIRSASGLGKTLFLNNLAGQVSSFEGQILFNGHELEWGKVFFEKTCSYVTSDGCFLGDLTAGEQFSLVSSDQSQIDFYVKKLKIESILRQKICLCSRGEQKKIEIVTALLKNTPILLLDEPSANLDQDNSAVLFDVLKEYAKSHLVIVSTHETEWLTDESSLYEIIDKELKLSKNSILSEETKNEEQVSFSKTSAKSVSLFHLSLRHAFRNQLMFSFCFLFTVVLLLGAFISFHLTLTDKSNTFYNGLTVFPDEYTKVNVDFKDTSELENNEIFTCTQLSAGLNDLNVACVEDLTGNLRLQCQRIFDETTLDYTGTDVLFFHPIIITVKVKSYFEAENLKLDIGDILPVEFENSHTTGSHCKEVDRFKIAGVLDSEDKDSDGFFLNTRFPCIIKQEDYITCIRHSGIRCSTINQSLLSLASIYMDYCKSHNMDAKMNESDFIMDSLIPFSKYRDLFKNVPEKESISQDDGYFYYYGEIPSQENWIMIPGDLNGMREFYSVVQNMDFFDSYKKGGYLEVGLKNPFGHLYYDSMKTVSLSGLFFCNDSKLNMRDSIIVSDSLFENLIDCIRKTPNQKESYMSSPSFASKKWLANHVDEIMNDSDIVQNSKSLRGMFLAFSNFLVLKNFIFILTCVFCSISLLLSSIYFIQLRKSFSNDFAVLKLFGYRKTDCIKILVSSFLPLILISYLTAVCLSPFISSLIVQNCSRASGFVGSIVFHNSYFCYFVQLGVLVLYFILVLLLSAIAKSKKSVITIKEKK